MANEKQDGNQNQGAEVNQKPGRGHYGNRPQLSDRGTSKIMQHFSRGMTYFLVVAASIIFYFALLRLTNISVVFVKIFDVLKPIVYGFVIAYLLNPMVKKVDQIVVPVLERKIKHRRKAQKLSRITGVLLSLLLMIVLIVALCNMLIPELYRSIRDVVVTLPEQLNDLMDKLNSIELDNSTTGILMRTAIEEGSKMFEEWLRTDLLRQANAIMSGLTVGVLSILSELFNAIIGVIVSVYVLMSKESFVQQSKKVVYALMTPHHANMVLHITRKSNQIFGGFIIGKVIDSAIIGVLCFLALSVLKMPYVLLVSVIVGVTNVIPFFGPYIGAIPSSILILLVDPIKGIYFIIFIIFLQQLDGNFIGPKILGDSTGLSAFWVIFSILLGGGLFGFAGMLMGVPTFAVIYYIVQMFVNYKLEKRNLPRDSKYYDEMSYVDDSGKYVFSDERISEKK